MLHKCLERCALLQHVGLVQSNKMSKQCHTHSCSLCHFIALQCQHSEYKQYVVNIIGLWIFVISVKIRCGGTFLKTVKIHLIFIFIRAFSFISSDVFTFFLVFLWLAKNEPSQRNSSILYLWIIWKSFDFVCKTQHSMLSASYEPFIWTKLRFTHYVTVAANTYGQLD